MQNYANHRRILISYHVLTFSAILLGLIGALVNLSSSVGTPGLYSASLVALVYVIIVSLFFHSRIMALKAQDRAIRAEENLRHFILTGKALPSSLKPLQIVALRFASDEEFPALAEKANREKMNPEQIKKEIKNWKEDTYRV